MPLIPDAEAGRSLSSSLVYRANSRTARATQRSLVSKNKNKNNKKKLEMLQKSDHFMINEYKKGSEATANLYLLGRAEAVATHTLTFALVFLFGEFSFVYNPMIVKVIPRFPPNTPKRQSACHPVS